jgi:hypothetical protein
MSNMSSSLTSHITKVFDHEGNNIKAVTHAPE